MEGEEVVQHGEINAAEQHGESHYILLGMGKAFQAVVVDGETTRGDVGEGDVDGVPHMHAALPQCHDKGCGEQQVDAESLLHGGGHGGRLLAGVVCTRGFGSVEAVFVDAQGGH